MKLRELFKAPIQLDEVAMNPSNLQKLAANIAGRAGLEFEMYAPIQFSSDENETEDYSEDEYCNSISDIVQFFNDGGGHTDDLEVTMNNLYQSYANDYEYSMWHNEKEDEVKNYIKDYDWDEDEKIEEALAELGLDEDEAQAAIEAKDDAWLGAVNLVEEWLDERVADSIKSEDRMYNWAYEQWQETSTYPGEQEWLRFEGLRKMSDVPNSFDIQWPYYSSGIDEYFVDSLRRAVGKDVETCSGYHECQKLKGPDNYVIEPDGSLTEPEDRNDSGIEIVSPPLSIDEMLDQYNRIREWAKSAGCYTNETTGLHMNISIDDISVDQLDYVKLALFLGDNHILNSFARYGNTYCSSSIDLIKKNIEQNPFGAINVLSLMKQRLNDVASHLIHDGLTDKMVSINVQDNRVEFRGPGNDWLNADTSLITNTLLRCTVALDIACDPEKYKEEYARKLYQLIMPSDDAEKSLSSLSKVLSGAMTKEAWKEQMLNARAHTRLIKTPQPATQAEPVVADQLD